MTNPTLPEMSRKVYEAMADKTISQGCIILDEREKKTVSIVFTAGGWKDKVDKKNKEQFYVEFCGWSGDVSLYYIEETMEIIGHPLHIGGIIQYLRERDDDKIIHGHSISNVASYHGDNIMTFTGGSYDKRNIIDLRPEGKKDQSLPLDPDESRRPLLEKLTTLIEENSIKIGQTDNK